MRRRDGGQRASEDEVESAAKPLCTRQEEMRDGGAGRYESDSR